jgi:hypothetical protein
MMQKLPARIVAVLLLLSLFQKMGMELWLHHFLHETPIARQVRAGRGHEAALQQAPVHCSCLDDTLMPMVGAASFVLHTTVTVLGQRPDPATSPLYPTGRRFHALRGPPHQA